jgi:hypothetical protein
MGQLESCPMIKVDCPKCGSHNAYYQHTEYDKILRCLCGYHKVIETTLESFIVERNDVGADVKLPRRGTNIWMTLATLANAEGCNSAELTQIMVAAGHSFTVSDVSSHLTILRSKGLVANIEIRRGISGGSTWRISESCKNLLGI